MQDLNVFSKQNLHNAYIIRRILFVLDNCARVILNLLVETLNFFQFNDHSNHFRHSRKTQLNNLGWRFTVELIAGHFRIIPAIIVRAIYSFPPGYPACDLQFPQITIIRRENPRKSVFDKCLIEKCVRRTRGGRERDEAIRHYVPCDRSINRRGFQSLKGQNPFRRTFAEGFVPVNKFNFDVPIIARRAPAS